MSTTQQLTIDYSPRRWARGLHANLHRWAVLVLHRRAGKTTAIINHHQRYALDSGLERQRLRFLLPDASDAQVRKLMMNRIYWHVMPSLKQAKIVAWDMLKRIAADVPGARTNGTDLEVTYPDHGYGPSKLRLLGADDPDSLRGPGLSGLSLDEWSQIQQRVFGEVLSKALADHVGYCIWSGTIKGKDQLYQIYHGDPRTGLGGAASNPEWYAVWQDIDKSLATEAGPTITALSRAMADDRKLVAQGVMTQDEFDQEWYLSADAAIQGAWYAKELQAAKADGRITRVPYDPSLPVDTDWDLGMSDEMSIWFSQSLRSGEVRLIDYYSNSGEGFQHYIKALKEKPYVYGKHHAPWDINIGEMSLDGKSRKQNAAALGLRFEEPMPMTKSVTEDIDVVRAFLSRCWFDEVRCAAGIEGLRHYRKTFNARMGEYTAVPVHNFASHPADAFRTLAKRWAEPRRKREHGESGVRYSDTSMVGGWMGN